MKKIKLQSGKELEIQLAPFSDANALNKAVAKELRALKMDMSADLSDSNFMKDLVCTAIASDEITSCLWQCFKRCTYNGVKITEDSFESEEARGDYFTICREVLMANIGPFIKGLISQFGGTKAEMKA